MSGKSISFSVPLADFAKVNEGPSAAPGNAQQTCEAKATAAQLVGMAKASFINKCVTDAVGK